MFSRHDHGKKKRTGLWVPALVLFSTFAVLESPRPAQAMLTQIGQFINDGSTGFSWTNNGGSATLTSLPANGSQVYFQYSNLAGLPPELQSLQSAHLMISASTTTPGYMSSGQANQPISGPITITITRDTPDPGFGTGGHNILLQTTVAPATGLALIAGQGGSAGLNATVPNETVTYKSDFFDFSKASGNSFGLTLSGISPALSFNDPQGGTILNSFTSSGVGSFSTVTIPEPASVALLGIGCVVLVGARARKTRKTA